MVLMDINLHDWLKYLGLTFLIGIIFLLLILLIIFTITKFLQARRAILDFNSSLWLGIAFRNWVRKHLQENPELQKRFPKERYLDYYNGKDDDKPNNQ
ncbi:hypothetical protein C5O19_11275 [Siphonobacter curvatus]|uniref:Uncharacterized protein n=1 Tax=Siphonobacter curvatus TaxID=2094562 RepID=A0A2S7IRA3_9BACT|nr:hypothetical protein C5O19_11275 [Siphonobacter curvatus]